VLGEGPGVLTMRLLIVSSWLPYPLDNGSRLRAYHLLNHLSRRHLLTLLSFGVPDAPEDLGALRALCGRVETVPPSGLEGQRLGPRGLLSLLPRYYVQSDSAQMRARVAAALPGHDAAVGLQANAARYLADWCDRIPAVFDEVEVGVFRDRYAREPRLRARLRHGLTWWKFRRFIRRLVDRFEQATVVSDLEREHLRAMGCDAGRITVVPNGIEIPPVSPPAVRAPRLVYPGSVTYSANLDAVRYFVREVFPLVRRARPDFTFCVTGATDGVEVSELAAVDGVTFTGRLPDVSSLMAESAACVVPLREGGGTRLKVLHGLAVGTPVVSTSKGIEGLEVEPGRHLLVGDGPEAFAAQVLAAVNDRDLGGRLASAGRQLVQERYAWGPIAATLERVIEQAVASHGSRRGGRAAP